MPTLKVILLWVDLLISVTALGLIYFNWKCIRRVNASVEEIKIYIAWWQQNFVPSPAPVLNSHPTLEKINGTT